MKLKFSLKHSDVSKFVHFALRFRTNVDIDAISPAISYHFAKTWVKRYFFLDLTKRKIVSVSYAECTFFLSTEKFTHHYSETRLFILLVHASSVQKNASSSVFHSFQWGGNVSQNDSVAQFSVSSINMHTTTSETHLLYIKS